MGIAEINRTQLYYEMQGNGPPLVFIHGGGLDRRMWDDQFDTFADRYTVIRYDVRGHGNSPPPTKPYSDDEDLSQLLRFLSVARANVIGLSLGGRIAIDCAVAHPDIVETLIAVAPGLSGYPYSGEDMLEFAKIVYSIQEDDGTPAGELWLQSPYNVPAMENPAVAPKLRPIAIDNSRFWLINPLFARPPFPPAIQRLSEIRVPTLLIVGDRDVPVVQSIVRMLESGIPAARKAVIPGAGHVVNMENPAQFNQIVRNFLSKGEGRSGQ